MPLNMDGKDSWGKPSRQRQPSYKKCGLKTKVNIPKGGPTKKTFGTSTTNSAENELSKVFAARNKKIAQTTETFSDSSTLPVEKPGVNKLIQRFQDGENETCTGHSSAENQSNSNSAKNVPDSVNSLKKPTVVSDFKTKTGSSQPVSKPFPSTKPVLLSGQKYSKDSLISTSGESKDKEDNPNTHDKFSSSQIKPGLKGKPSKVITKFEDTQGSKSYNKAPPPPSGRKPSNVVGKLSDKEAAHVNQSLSGISPTVLRKTEGGASKTPAETTQSNVVPKNNCNYQSSSVSINSVNQRIETSEQGKQAGMTISENQMNKAPPPPRKLTYAGGAHSRSHTVAQLRAKMSSPKNDGVHDQVNKALSVQVIKNKAPTPPRKQKSETQETEEVVTKDNNFNNVKDVTVLCSVDSDSDEWVSEQEETSTKHKLRRLCSSDSRKSGGSSRKHKLKKYSPHHKPAASLSVDKDQRTAEGRQDAADLGWETEEEERVDSGGYEIVEKGPDGRLIFRSVSEDKKTIITSVKTDSPETSVNSSLASTDNLTRTEILAPPTSLQAKDAPARRMDFAMSHIDWDSEYVDPDPDFDSYTEFDPSNPIPLPPRPSTLKTTSASPSNSLDRATLKTTTTNSPSPCKSPLSQQVQLPQMTECLSPRHRTSPQGSPSQSRCPPPLPSKESISRLSQVVDDRTPIPPQRKKRSIDCESPIESEAPPFTPRRSSAPADSVPPPLPPRRVPDPRNKSLDSDIPELPPPPPPSCSAGRNLTVPSSKPRARSPGPGSSRPPPPPLPEHSADTPSSTESRRGHLSALVPLPSFEQSDGYLKPGSSLPSKGYLDMDKQRPKGGSYIDPVDDLASVPDHCPTNDTKPGANLPPLVIEPASGEAEQTVTSPHNYLQLVDADFQPDSACSTLEEGSDLFHSEPLYQIYHQGAVLRNVMDNDCDYVLENKDPNDIYCDAESARVYVSGILSRINSVDSLKSSVKSDSPSCLELIVETGQAVRTLWSETEVVQTSEEAGALSVEERKIQEALFEIITSEASYLKSLDLLLSHYVKSAALNYDCIHTTAITKREHQVLFSNVRKVRNVSQRFLKELEKLWRKSCVLTAEEVCDVIARYAANKFDVYVKYCSNQAFQLRELDRLREKNPTFVYEIERLNSDRVCQGQNIQSFLTLPMQRVTRLPLLVDAVCHRLDPKKQQVYNKVTHALSTLQKLVKECNEGARQMNNIEEVNHIDRMLDFKHIKKIPIVSQSRSIVKKGPLVQLLSPSGLFFKKKSQTLDLFLFNDILIITKKKGDQCYSVENYSPRISVHADFLTEQQMQKLLPGGPTGYSHLFLLVLLEKKLEYVFSCESMSECARWVEAIEPAQSQTENERIYEEWDCPQVQAVHSYTAKEPDELSLEESDVINVFKKMADGWFEGERIRDGARGWFPSDHVVEIQSQHVRAKNLRQQYRMLQMSNRQLADMLENPVKAWKEIDEES